MLVQLYAIWVVIVYAFCITAAVGSIMDGEIIFPLVVLLVLGLYSARIYYYVKWTRAADQPEDGLLQDALSEEHLAS